MAVKISCPRGILTDDGLVVPTAAIAEFSGYQCPQGFDSEEWGLLNSLAFVSLRSLLSRFLSYNKRWYCIRASVTIRRARA